MISNKNQLNLDDPVISIIYPAMLVKLVERWGVSADALLDAAEISPLLLSDAEIRISQRRFLFLVKQALRLTKEPALGFYYGNMLDVTSSGPVSIALLSSATLGDALNIILKFYPSNGISMDMNFESIDDHIVASCANLDYLDQNVQIFIFEALLSSWLRHCRYLTGEKLFFSEVKMVYSQPKHYKLYKAMLGCDAVFSHIANQVKFPLSFLKLTVPTANETVHDLSIKQCEKNLRNIEHVESLPGRIAQMLFNYQGNFPGLEKMAANLQISPRSLSRQLSELGTSYQRILDDIRRQKAVRFIKDDGLSVEKVAQRLGFSDASNFRRAFKKWTGVTPTEYRQIIEEEPA